MLVLTHLNADDTVSIKDTSTEEIRHFTKDTIPNTFILGVFRGIREDNKGTIVDLHPILADEVSAPLLPLINEIKTPELREFVNWFRRIIPEHFFHVPASSSGKYHPGCNLGEGGLLRHTIFVCENFKYITSLESTRMMMNCSQEEYDCMLIACIFHDFMKDGWYNDASAYCYHAKAAAHAFRTSFGAINPQYIELIAHCIESHMGQWGEPKPNDKYQWLVHLCDYMASRKNINMSFGNKVYVYGNTEVIDVSSDEMKTTMESKKGHVEKKKLSDEMVAAIQYFLANQVPIDEDAKKHLEITRSNSEILDIANTMLKYCDYSEKQEKYIRLIIASVAKVISKQ